MQASDGGQHIRASQAYEGDRVKVNGEQYAMCIYLYSTDHRFAQLDGFLVL